MLKISILPFRVESVEQQAFGSAERVDGQALHLGEIGLPEFVQGLGSNPCGIARERLEVGEGSVLRGWFVLRRSLRGLDLRVAGNPFLPELET